jgi:dTDP-glucose 4,6-dehydratase
LVTELVSSADAVINFAAETHNDNSLLFPEKFFATNVMGTLNVAQACVRNGVKLHHVSTDEVFGELDLNSSEEFRLSSNYRPSSPYSASKASSDHIVRAWVRSFGLSATISNCSNNYGQHQHWEKLIPATIKRIFQEERPIVYGQGANVRDWIHVNDHVDGVLLAVEKGIPGQTYLFGARNQLTNLEVVKSILVAMGKPEDFIDFVADRPGHDTRYAIDPTSAEAELGFSPSHPNLLDEIENLVSHYTSRLTDGR